MAVKRLYLDALIESFLSMLTRLPMYSDEWLACRNEVDRLRGVQCGLGHSDYYVRYPEAA